MIDYIKKTLKILIPVERIKGLKVFTFMTIGMVLETLGVGLIIPTLIILADKDILLKYPLMQDILQFFNNPTQMELIIGGILTLFVVYMIKAVFLAYLAYRQTEFAYSVQARLSQHLFFVYLNQSYTFHLQRNSAQLVNNCVEEVNVFTSHILHPGVILLSEVLVLIGISCLLLFIEPIGAISVILLMGLAGFIFYRSTRARIARWGKARQKHDGLKIQHLQQGLGAVKDVLLLGREYNFLEKYQVSNFEGARVGKFQTTLQQLPRLWLEVLAVLGMASLVVVMIMQGSDIAKIIPTIGLFAAAAFRLMPSVNRALSSLQSIRFGLPVVDRLSKELKLSVTESSVKNSSRLMFRNEVKLENIKYTYPGSSEPAIKDMSMTFKAGETIGFIGTSGCGKSTLIDIILGLHEADSGLVKVDGLDIKRNLRQWQNQIGYVPQSIYLTDETLRENIAFGIPSEQIDDAAVIEAVKAAQLQEFVTNQPEGLETNVGERGVRLSGGQRQRIGIARALYHNPTVLVLDEATSALDVELESEVMQAVAALQGKTILIVAHRLNALYKCDFIYHLDNGKLINSCSYKELCVMSKGI